MGDKIKLTISRTVFTLLTFLLSLPAAGQTGLNIAVQTLFDGNTFRNYENIPDIINQPEIMLYHTVPWVYGSFNIFYSGGASFFRDYSLRRYYSHAIGITGSALFSPTAPKVTFGLQSGGRYNREEYNYYDYRSLDAHCRVDFDTHEMYRLSAGSRFSMRDYRYLSEFSNYELAAYVKTSLFLKTHTTIIILVQPGYKSFFDNEINSESIEEMDWSAKGSGRGWGRNRTPGGTEEASDVRIVNPGDRVLQLAGSIRAAQSLGAKTGIAAEYGLQRNQQGESRILTGQDSGYETNDDLFDDPYNYDLDRFTAEFTRILPMNIRFQAAGSYSDKRYDRPAFDIDGEQKDGIDRTDQVTVCRGTLSKTFPFRGPMISMTLAAHYMLIKNVSNDPYYNYKNTISSLALSFSF